MGNVVRGISARSETCYAVRPSTMRQLRKCSPSSCISLSMWNPATAAPYLDLRAARCQPGSE
ncbi:hypothetical protein JOD52_001929 [Brachybacterium muris]|nr:hypothetical protein [Brachybacterium muris]